MTVVVIVKLEECILCYDQILLMMIAQFECFSFHKKWSILRLLPLFLNELQEVYSVNCFIYECSILDQVPPLAPGIKFKMIKRSQLSTTYAILSFTGRVFLSISFNP